VIPRADETRRGDAQRAPSFIRPALSASTLLLLLATAACEGTVDPCLEGPCPLIPGCEEESEGCDAQHLCLERVCDGVGWSCGLGAGGAAGWYQSAAPCDDQDPCTDEDRCERGQCLGQAKVCNSPPAPVCTGPTELTLTSADGTCQDGQCSYPTTKIDCKSACEMGTCKGDPCLGLSCDNPPGPCHESPGKCSNGSCIYSLKLPGSSCVPADACVVDAVCSAAGSCEGKQIDCQSLPHASGGSCLSGKCQGYNCEPGWGDCNPDWKDGCETRLDTPEHCGSCQACPSAPNADATCVSGSCGLACKAPYKDCDGNRSNGCELPEGEPNRCNDQGLVGEGDPISACGTPYCGNPSGGNFTDHGSWYCRYCSHCIDRSPGQGSWCLWKANGGVGNFSSDIGAVGSQVCKPNGSYPWVCPR